MLRVFYVTYSPIIFPAIFLEKIGIFESFYKFYQNLQYANLFGSNSIFSSEDIIKKGGQGPKGPSVKSLIFSGLSNA